MNFGSTMVAGAMSILGCGRTQSDVRQPTLLAYAGPIGKAPVAGGGPTTAVIRVERIPQEILRDPARMVSVRLWMERQIATQTRDIPEPRYQRVIRPGLAHELAVSGLSSV